MTTAEEIAQTVVGGTPAAPVRISDLDRWHGASSTHDDHPGGWKPGAILNVARRASGDILSLDAAVLES